MISRKPRLIAKCADVADVITAVNFARKHDLRVSIRGGGHNAGGLRLPLVEATEQETEAVRAMLERHELLSVPPARAPA